MAELIGTTRLAGRFRIVGTVAELRRAIKRFDDYGDPPLYWAMYRSLTQYGRFHNATDKRFLIEHHNDPYWLNRGVPSKS